MSRAIIGTDEVVVSGLPFLRGESRAIPGNRLVSKMLCKRHNEMLSPTDKAAGQLFTAVKTFKHRGVMRALGASKPGGADVYMIDGALVERWMLKTVTNILFDREIVPKQRWKPNRKWVECAFGRSAFPERCGLYLLEGESSVELSEFSKIGIRPLIKDNQMKSVVGGQFRMEHLQFALAMEPLHAEHMRTYRTRAIHDTLQTIHFDWTKLSSG